MSIDVSYDVRVAGGTTPLGRTRVLPDLPGSAEHRPSTVEQLGRVVGSSLPLVAGASAIGAIAGAKLLPRLASVFSHGLLGGLAGAIVGAGLVLGAGMIANRGRDARPEHAAGATAPSSTVRGREQVKVMTYNLHGGMGASGEMWTNEHELDQLAETIRREQPDILMFQESDSDAVRSNMHDTMAELAERLHPASAVEGADTTKATGRSQYVGVMTFNGFTVDNARNIRHEDPEGGNFLRRAAGVTDDIRKTLVGVLGLGEDRGVRLQRSYTPRNTIETIVRTPEGNDVRVLAGHYSGPSSEHDFPSLSVYPLAGALQAWDGPTIWGADFNVRSGTAAGDREASAMAGAGLTDAFTSLGIEPDDPVRGSLPHAGNAIDRIYASAHFSVQDAHVVHEQGDTASDHRPVVATITLGG